MKREGVVQFAEKGDMYCGDLQSSAMIFLVFSRIHCPEETFWAVTHLLMSIPKEGFFCKSARTSLFAARLLHLYRSKLMQ